MTRAEFVQRLVLNTICDDYENVDQVILREVVEVGAKCGLTIQRSDVVDALRGLVEAGLAKAYALSSREPFSREIRGMPPLDVVEVDYRTYFYQTKKGMEFHGADGSWWPLDDEEKFASRLGGTTTVDCGPGSRKRHISSTMACRFNFRIARHSFHIRLERRDRD